MESLKLKKVVTMGVNSIDMKVEEKSLEESLPGKGTTTPDP